MNQDKVWKQGQEFWNSTMTSLSHGARDLWKNPRITMIRIEVLVLLVAAALFFLAIFGSQRRRSRNGFLQKGVFLAFTLSFSMATYILGSMQSSGVKSSMYPIWAISLIMLHGCTDSITAYSVDDNRQLATLTYQAYMYFAYALLLLISVRTAYTWQVALVACIAFYRYAQRLAACFLVGNSRNWNKIVADYMYEEQNKGVFGTMEECSYLVDWPIRKSKFDAPTYATQLTANPAENEVIGIGKIWQCKAMPLVLKDTCLSFSLFHLLRSRCFGFAACDEYKDSAHNFLFGVLLQGKKKDCQVDDNRVLLEEEEKKDCKRVFKVIEVELAFMYDFFFTKYAVIYYGSIAATVWSLISAISMFVMAYITAMTPVKITQGDSVVAGSITDDIVITIVILASIGLLEFLQLLLYWTGIWGRVSFVCQSIRENGRSNRTGTRGRCLIMRLKKFLASIGMSCASRNHYWQHKIGQYSLLDSVGSRPKRSFLAIYCYNRFTVILGRILYLADYAFNHPINNQALAARNKAEKSVELPDEVKEALIRSLKHNGSKLSNGESSLKSNEAYHHLLWACQWEMHPDQGWSQRKQNQTHIILTWHIATWYCENTEKVPLSPDGPEDLKAYLSIATKLSKYCAYLVVSAPKLLPGHHYDTVRKLDAVVAEAVLVLQSATNMYEGMKSLTVPQEQGSSVTNSIFESGVKLGKQLQAMEDVGKRWRVMANFWAEMMLYVAPSDNVNEHIEQLAKGGELITHLWALLSHAGIVKREQEHQAGDLEAGASG